MKLPTGQKLWETFRDEKGRVIWAIASDPARTVYILYRVYGQDVKKVRSASSPMGFEKEIGVRI